MKRILIIDHDAYSSGHLAELISKKGFRVDTAFNARSATTHLKKKRYDLVITDNRLPDGDGLKIIQNIREKDPLTQVIIVTNYEDVRSAVKLIKAGAIDYLTKPVQPDEILDLVEKTMQKRTSSVSGLSFSDEFITGESKQFAEVMEHVRIVAPTELTVMIQGETGSGKEYVARAIHHYSRRSKRPFIAVDCGAIPKTLANSELFGHVKGAYTGAGYDKPGYFEQANGGTLFLDEISNLTQDNQMKLLRALQDRLITRLGDTKKIYINVRVLVASNEDLFEEVQRGNLREDLYYRLNEFKINIPSLRERGNDVDIFAKEFLKRANKRFNKSVKGFSRDFNNAILSYPWHGNVRELENVIRRCVLLSDDEMLQLTLLPPEIRNFSEEEDHLQEQVKERLGLKKASNQAEKEVIINALVKTNNNKSKAAKLLNIDRKTLYNKIKQYSINIDKPNQ